MRFGHRDYDPDIGRFAAQDPMGDTGGDHYLCGRCVDNAVRAMNPGGSRARGLETPGPQLSWDVTWPEVFAIAALAKY